MVRVHKLRSHLIVRLEDAMRQKERAKNATTKEYWQFGYWLGKETAYRELLAIVRGEIRI